MKINWLVTEILVEGFTKQQKTKEIFAWLYLKINICEFQLILLDHITYDFHEMEKSICMKRGHITPQIYKLCLMF